MKRRSGTLAALTLAIACIHTHVASADVDGDAQGDELLVTALESTPSGEPRLNDAGSTPAATSTSPYRAYRWRPACDIAPGVGTDVDCGAAQVCTNPSDRLWRLWGQLARGNWEPLGTRCFGERPTAADTPTPQVTPGLVLEALRRIGLPALEVQTQPEDKTLVNFETIFYAEPQTFTRTITLLGQSVDVEATPSSYTWHHGDGTATTTREPGAPYPAKDITHEYAQADQTVQTSVDVTYSARFRVGGGAWQDIDETVTISGPPSDLQISEATALLSGEYR